MINKSSKKNVLTFAALVEIGDWMRSNQPDFAGLTYQQVADKATEKLGFNVTEANVLQVKKSFNVQWYQPRGAPTQQTAEQKAFKTVVVAQLNLLIDALGAEKTPAFARLSKQLSGLKNNYSGVEQSGSSTGS